MTKDSGDSVLKVLAYFALAAAAELALIYLGILLLLELP